LLSTFVEFNYLLLQNSKNTANSFSKMVESEEQEVVSEQTKTMWLGQPHLLLWAAGELPYPTQARNSLLFQLRECVS